MGLLGLPQLLGGDRLPGGEEDRYLHTSRTLQDQDPHKASHEGRSEECLRQRNESCRQTGEEGGESLPSARSEAADLDQLQKEEMIASPEAQLMWESHGASLEGAQGPHPMVESLRCSTSLAHVHKTSIGVS